MPLPELTPKQSAVRASLKHDRNGEDATMHFPVAGPWGDVHIPAKALAGTDDFDAPLALLSRLPAGMIVFDPCCGKGNTAVSAAICGHRFIGNELAPHRAASTLAALFALEAS